MSVHRELGYGLTEKPYENALTVEFEAQNIPFTQQPRFDIHYRDRHVGTFIPDLIAFEKIIVDTKAISGITEKEVSQMLNYLRVSNLEVGLIINFGRPSLDWRRVALGDQSKKINLR